MYDQVEQPAGEVFKGIYAPPSNLERPPSVERAVKEFEGSLSTMSVQSSAQEREKKATRNRMDRILEGRGTIAHGR